MCSEDSGAQVAELVRLHGGDDSRLHILDIATVAEIPDIARDSTAFERWIRECNARLVIVDAVNCFLSSPATTDSQARRNVMGPLTQVASRTRSLIIGVRNVDADGRAYGPASMRDMARVDLRTLKPNEGEESDYCSLFFRKISDGVDSFSLKYRPVNHGDRLGADSYKRTIEWRVDTSTDIVNALKKRKE